MFKIYNKNSGTRGGYIALITSVIIMLIILSAASIMSSTTFFGFFDIDSMDKKDTSRSLVLGCLNYVLLQLADDNYAGGEDIIIGDNVCTIEPITINGNETVIHSSASVRDSYTRLRLTVDSFSLEEISLYETQ